MINNAEFIVKTLHKLSHEYRILSIRIESSWGTERCNDLLIDLLTAKDKAGFDYEIYTLILMLYSIHSDQYGRFGKSVNLDHMNIDQLSFDKDRLNRMTPDQAIKQLREMLPKIETEDEVAARLASKLVDRDKK